MRSTLAAAVIGSGLFLGSIPQPAQATLAGSTFNGADASPTSDLAAGAVAISDPVGNQDTTNYTGSDENEQCPQLAIGTASPKDDLDVFYVGSKANLSGVFLYVGWHRVATSGTTTIDFELNHLSDPPDNCNDVNPERSVGDLLITYDFQGSGPFTLDISQRTWTGSAWSGPSSLPAGSFEASINSDGDFGELVVNLTLANLLGTNGCESFATVFPKSRSSSQSFTSAIKEYVAPFTTTISNCGSVSIHKQDDTGAAMANVVFDLYTDVANAPGVLVVPAKNCTTNASGNCTITDILPGTYWVVERAAPSGYTGAAAQKVAVAVGGNTPAGTLTFVNTRKPAQVNIVKKNDAGAALAGATFGLFNDDNGSIGTAVSGKTCTTGSDGKCSITNILPPGTYWVRETVVPAGHSGAADQQVTLGLDQTVTLNFVDTRLPAKVDIVKKDDNGAFLAGAVFGLFNDDNGAVGTAVSGKTCTTGSDGKCSISNILPPGTYWVRETTVPAGYTGAADQQVTLGLNQTVTLTFINTRKPATINIVKKDDAGAFLAGATFGLFNDDNGSKGSAVSGKTCTTDADGECTIANILPPGTYWVSETATPTGHDTADDQKVTLGLNQTVTLTFVNDRQPAQVDIVKKDDNGAALAGATFGLFTDNSGSKGTAVSGKTCTTGSSGLCSITGILPPGTYWVSETVVPTGYTGAADQKVTLALNQTVELTFVNVRKPATVVITKKDDAGANLAGAGFTLYTDDNGARGTAVPNKSCTTNAAGTCTISNILPPGTYWVHESTVPTGYTAAPDQQVTLGLNQTVTLNFVDVRQPATVNIVKKNDAGAALAGAVFALYTDNAGAVGTAVTGKTCTTNSSGLCTINGILPPATYWVVETTTPAGHYTADAQQVTLGLNQTVTLNFVDVRKPIAISIVKTANGSARPQNDPLNTESGELVTYVLTITNEGEQDLTITALTDDKEADVLDFCEQALGSTLAPDADFTCTYTANPTADVHNTAGVTGTDVLGRTTSDTDEAFVVPLHPAINVEKTGVAGAHVGDVVTYTFTVTNTGDTPLDDVAVDDPRCNDDPVVASKSGGDDDDALEGVEVWVFECEYTVVAADGNSVINVATASGTDLLGTVVTDVDDHTFPVLHPAITIDKTADPVSVTGSGTVTYSYLVTNTGDTALLNVAVTDNILGAIGTIDRLEPGESRTLTRAVAVGTGSPPTNIGTASGTDVLGKTVTASDTQTITVVLGQVFTRELPRTGAPIERQVRWAAGMVLAGLFLVVTARRRRRVSDSS